MRKFIAERATVKTELEVQPNNRARIWVEVTIDGEPHKYVLTAGPEVDVRAYFDGEIDIAELRRRWDLQTEDRAFG